MSPDEIEARVLEYLPLAQSLAQQVYRTAPHALDLDELRGIAYLALVTVAHRWLPYCLENDHDPAALQYFKPFVVRRVYGALIDASRSADWATRSLRTKAKLLQEAGQERGLSDRELADRSGLTLREVRSTIREMSQRPVSLEGEELELETGGSVEADVFTDDVLARVVAVIEDLEPQQRVVLALHYFEGRQLQQVAKEMGITESRASQLHARAVLTVHQAMVETALQHEDPHAL